MQQQSRDGSLLQRQAKLLLESHPHSKMAQCPPRAHWSPVTPWVHSIRNHCWCSSSSLAPNAGQLLWTSLADCKTQTQMQHPTGWISPTTSAEWAWWDLVLPQLTTHPKATWNNCLPAARCHSRASVTKVFTKLQPRKLVDCKECIQRTAEAWPREANAAHCGLSSKCCNNAFYRERSPCCKSAQI